MALTSFEQHALSAVAKFLRRSAAETDAYAGGPK
jgi:hypothetical protein